MLQEFKSLMTKTPELRSKLEMAVRNSQQANNNIQKAKIDAANAAKANLQPAKPTIQLKTDFSNFSK